MRMAQQRRGNRPGTPPSLPRIRSSSFINDRCQKVLVFILGCAGKIDELVGCVTLGDVHWYADVKHWILNIESAWARGILVRNMPHAVSLGLLRQAVDRMAMFAFTMRQDYHWIASTLSYTKQASVFSYIRLPIRLTGQFLPVGLSIIILLLDWPIHGEIPNDFNFFLNDIIQVSLQCESRWAPSLNLWAGFKFTETESASHCISCQMTSVGNQCLNAPLMNKAHSKAKWSGSDPLVKFRVIRLRTSCRAFDLSLRCMDLSERKKNFPGKKRRWF